MKKRLLSLTSAVVMLLTLVVGCAGTGTSNPSGGKDPANENTAQLVVAMNPILVYDDGETVIPYNDIKNAIKADFEGSTLTTLHQSTAYNWMYKTGADWQKRAIHTLDNWTNGAGAEARSSYSYGFNHEGTISLASYYAQSIELGTYGDTDSVPDYGLLLSVTGAEEEALVYTVQKDGMLNLAEGFITAIQSVAGVNTGFLAEDGTARSASFRIAVNDVQVFSGTLCNSTASPDGKAVTSLSYEQISDLPVEAGDMVFLAVRLNATANKDEDQSAGEYNEDDNWTTVGKEVQVPITEGSENNGSSDTVVQEDQSLSIFDGFDSRFLVVRSNELSGDFLLAAGDFRTNMEYILDTEVLIHNESHDEELYEIVIGPMESRPESVKLHNELLNYRPNNANDFIIRRVGTKVYIAAVNADAMRAAMDYFLNTFCSSEDGAVPADYRYAYQAPSINAYIGDNAIGNYVIRVEKYPSLMVYRAAEELQNWIRETCGYLVPLTPMTDDGKTYEYEIRVGPQNGSVKVHRLYDTRFTNKTMQDGNWSVDPNGLLTGVAANYYSAGISGKHLVINGGSSYAVNAAVMAVAETIEEKKALPSGYAIEGVYTAGEYSLTGGYDLMWQEEFSYTGTDEEMDKEFREYWTISTDNANGPTALSTSADGTVNWDQQRRPGVYGDNWWIWHDKSTGNGYLLEITKKEEYGYDAGRVISQNKWSFRYGIWETRIVVGTRNGSCSAIWSATAAPNSNEQRRNEIDVYENFGRDRLVANYHTWQSSSLGGHINHNASGGMLHVAAEPAYGEHFYDTFHSISIEWTPTMLVFYLDGAMFDRINLTDIPSGRSSTTIKYANGVGGATYCKGYNPQDFMNEEYTALTGKTVKDFFEVQTIDYAYIYQTSNEGKKSEQQSTFKYDRRHPNNKYYTGYLSKTDGWTSVQIPE